MMSFTKSLPVVAALTTLVAGFLYLSACASKQQQQWEQQLGSGGGGMLTAPGLLDEVNLQQDFIPAGKYGRRLYRPMYPTYITIHETENPDGDAYDHAKALKVGALRAHQRPGFNRIGFLAWHFTVQQDVAIQHIPTREQGEHADFDGPGNNYSIGIEMCDNRGNSFPQTMERAARLAAYLMRQHNIPLNHVVPHYYWARVGVSPLHKPCPQQLMDGGRPGRKWSWFLSRVRSYYVRLAPGTGPRL